jgi:hypothetical protein
MRASACQRQAKEVASTILAAVFGESTLASSASSGPGTSSSRTRRSSSREASSKSSKTFPSTGMMRSGFISGLQMSVPLIDVSESSWSPGDETTPDKLWPTATATDWKGSSKVGQRRGQSSESAEQKWSTPAASMPNDGEEPETWLARQAKLKEKGYNGNGAGMPLAIQAKIATKLWTTPTATDHKASGSAAYTTESGRHTGTTLTDQAVRRPNWRPDSDDTSGLQDPTTRTDGEST